MTFLTIANKIRFEGFNRFDQLITTKTELSESIRKINFNWIHTI